MAAVVGPERTATEGRPAGAALSSAPSALSLRDLRRSYGPVVAVDDVSLEVAQGEFVTLLGPSGSGKTTTLMMVAGFDEPDAGDIVCRGRSFRGVPPEHRDVGMVFQNYALFPHMTVAGNLAFPLRMRRQPRDAIATRVERMLQLLRLEGLGDRRPTQLSGGQQQRVALGRALIFGPQLTLMDEPLGALDRALREELQGEIKRICTATGTTSLYVTHDQGEAIALSDRIAIMRAGIIEQVASPEEVYRRPGTRFVAEFLGRATIIGAVVLDPGEGTVKVRARGADLDLRAATATPLSPGDDVEVVVRPEDVDVRPAQGDGRAWLLEEAFFGSSTRRRVRIGELELLSDDSLGRDHIGQGSPVDVAVRAAWVLPKR